jgi:hypothetical protein
VKVSFPDTTGSLTVVEYRDCDLLPGRADERVAVCKDRAEPDHARAWAVAILRRTELRGPLSEPAARYLASHLAGRLSGNGQPVHVRLVGAQRDLLTRCGLFARSMGGRVTTELAAVDCAACRSTGPAPAWVTLPDGQRIECRTPALRDYHYAVAIHPVDNRPWELWSWETDQEDAGFQLAREAGRGRREMVILRVEEAR